MITHMIVEHVYEIARTPAHIHVGAGRATINRHGKLARLSRSNCYVFGKEGVVTWPLYQISLGRTVS